jgi:hypothetical protein
MAMFPSDVTSSLDYQERVVAFIDVLGFADLVKASATDTAARDKTSKLIAIYKVFDWFVTEMLERLVEGGFFSDTFILSATLEQALYLIRETGNLCRFLLLQGFPCRGAIAAGLLHHRERIIIGPALIDAYRAEQSVAIYPRIVVDEATREIWAKECAPESAHSRLKYLIREDCDGQHYLDILDPQWGVFFPWTDKSGTELVPSDPAKFLTAASERIREGLKASSGNATVRAKYTWLAAKCEGHGAARR